MALVAAGCERADRGSGAGAAAGASVIADSVSLEEARGILAEAGADRVFERVAAPDPWLTDFFGVQPLRPVPPSRVIGSMTPGLGTLISEDAHSVVIQLTDGPRVTFRFGVDLFVNGNRVPHAWARVAIDRPADYPAETVAFRAALERAGLAETWLLPNPYFAIEQVVEVLMRTPERIEPVVPEPDTAGFGSSSHAVILVGETHGGTGPWEETRRLIASPTVDWLGIEMLGEDLQPALSAYLDAAPGTPRHTESRNALLDYYRANWNTRGHEVTADPAANPYFLLIEAARAARKPVRALDADASYILFRYGEFPLGATVRDYVWAANLPDAGRGVVYGGSSHFQRDRRPNMLTFVRERFPRVRLFAAPVR